MISQAQNTDDTEKQEGRRKLLIINENGSQFLVESYVTMDAVLKDPLLKVSLDVAGRVEIEIVPIREHGEALGPLDLPVVGERGDE